MEMKVDHFYPVLCDLRFKNHNAVKGERGKLQYITPLIDLKHDDKHNGQSYEHYHIDSRFVKIKTGEVRCNNGKKYMSREIRTTVYETSFFHIVPLKFYRHEYGAITNPMNIDKAPIRHSCIVNGKCPHKGMDLTDPKLNVDGIITCPLHGLQFHANTGEMVYAHQVMLNFCESDQHPDILNMPWED